MTPSESIRIANRNAQVTTRGQNPTFLIIIIIIIIIYLPNRHFAYFVYTEMRFSV